MVNRAGVVKMLLRIAMHQHAVFPFLANLLLVALKRVVVIVTYLQ